MGMDVVEEIISLDERMKKIEATVNKSNFSEGLDCLTPTKAQLDSTCLSRMHDHGLMSEEDQMKARLTALDWLIAWQKTFGLR